MEKKIGVLKGDIGVIRYLESLLENPNVHPLKMS
jgi:hypothetical protein